MSGTRLKRIWDSMKQRCENSADIHYKNYGGRGIAICDSWRVFSGFKEWALLNGYDKHLTLDRINNDGNYEPSNCRWTTQKEQCNNKRTNHMISYNGETKTIAQWAEATGITASTIEHRLNRGNWDIERALTTPMRKYKVKGE